jgi:hypothetical protein
MMYFNIVSIIIDRSSARRIESQVHSKHYFPKTDAEKGRVDSESNEESDPFCIKNKFVAFSNVNRMWIIKN